MDIDLVVRRKRHFKEVVLYAMERVSSGGQRASQRQLAERLMCAPGMIRRYLDQETSVEVLKYITLHMLAKACRLDTCSLFVWIEDGRDAAMEHEASLAGTMPPFSALDLAHRLVDLLSEEEGGQGDDGKDDPPGPDMEPLRQRVAVMEVESGQLFPRMVRLTESEDAIKCLLDSSVTPVDLRNEDWSALARLLEAEVAELKELCGMLRALA